MSAKFESFKAKLILICDEYQVTLSTSADGELLVWDQEIPGHTLDIADFIDKTSGDRIAAR